MRIPVTFRSAQGPRPRSSQWLKIAAVWGLAGAVLVGASETSLAQFSFSFGGGMDRGRYPSGGMHRPRYPGPSYPRPHGNPYPRWPRIPIIVPGPYSVPRPAPRPYPVEIVDEDERPRPTRRPRPAPKQPVEAKKPAPRKPVEAKRPAPKKPPAVARKPAPKAAPPAPKVAARPAARKPPPPPRVPAAPAPRPAVAPVAPVAPDYVLNEVLIEVRGNEPAAAVDRLAAPYGLTRVAFQQIELIGSTVYRYRINGRRSVDAVVAQLRANPRIASAQRNNLFSLQDSTQQAFLAKSQYAAGKLRLPEAHRIATGDGVMVAVIDSGVDASHPELTGAIAANVNALATDAGPDPHGTGMAAIIAARTQLMGVAPKSRLLTVRAFALDGKGALAKGTTFDVLKAVSIAAQAGARVVNMSFAGPKDDLLGRALAAGKGRNIVFVAAAGNGGEKAPPSYPAADPNVIAVTATDSADQLYGSANRGLYVAVAAPGVDVLVATPGAGYGFTSGTSVAAAHVSGVVALMLEGNAGLTPDEARRRLIAPAKDLGPPGPDPEYGAGLVDPVASLGGEAVAQATPPQAEAAAAQVATTASVPAPQPAVASEP